MQRIDEPCRNFEAFAIRCAQAKGVDAIVYQAYYTPPGALAKERYGFDYASMNIPAVLISYHVFAGIFNETLELEKSNIIEISGTVNNNSNETANATTYLTMIIRYSENPWTEVFNGPFWIGGEVICELINIYTLILSLLKWRDFVFYKDKRLKASTAQIILFLMCVGSLTRIVQGIDWLGKHGIYTFDVARALTSFSIPLNLSATLLLSLKLSETLKGIKSKTASSTASTLRYTSFYIVVIFSLVLDWVTTYCHLNGFSFVNLLLLYDILWQMGATFYLAMAYLYYGVRIIRLLTKGRVNTQSNNGSSNASVDSNKKKQRYIMLI
jgi:hypothetical protein